MSTQENGKTKNLVLDVSRVYNGATAEIPFDFSFKPEDEEGNDLLFPEDVRVCGSIFEKAAGTGVTESYVGLEMSIRGKYVTHCARCAKELTKTFDINASYGVTKDTAEDLEDYVEAPGGMLDVTESARTLFYLELPSRTLCKEDCLGLCPMCGKDLNTGECSCKPEISTNHLSDLKKLLDKHDEK